MEKKKVMRTQLPVWVKAHRFTFLFFLLFPFQIHQNLASPLTSFYRFQSRWNIPREFNPLLSHVNFVQALVAFIEHKLLDLIQLQILSKQWSLYYPPKQCTIFWGENLSKSPYICIVDDFEMLFQKKTETAGAGTVFLRKLIALFHQRNCWIRSIPLKAAALELDQNSPPKESLLKEWFA